MWPPPSPSPVQPGWPAAPKPWLHWSVPAWPPLPPHRPLRDKYGRPLPTRRELKRWRRDLAMPPLEELAWLSSDDEDSDMEEFWAEEERLIAKAMKGSKPPGGTSAKSEVSRISDEDDDDGEMPSWIRDDPRLASMVSKCHTHVRFHL